ncbi:MAG: hypothetical protein F4137_22910 [Acidobacteria bacterium]|nr:hypothetical protein [Acidobacteriota bacterium]
MTLRDDPAGIAPERAIVLEVAGAIADFQGAAQRIPGLEYLGDEEAEFEPDTDFAVRDTRRGRDGQVRDDKPVVGRLYLAMPDTRALRELLRLWDRYQAGERAGRGFGPWFDLFDRLRQLRAWGPLDRVPESTIEWLADELEARTDPARVEIELWSYQSTDRQQQSSVRFEQAVRAVGGEFLHRASIPEIAYEAALVNLPAAEVLRLQQRDQSPLTVCDDVMLVRPQSTAQFPTAVDTLGAGGTVEPAPTAGTPRLRLLVEQTLGHRTKVAPGGREEARQPAIGIGQPLLECVKPHARHRRSLGFSATEAFACQVQPVCRGHAHMHKGLPHPHVVGLNKIGSGNTGKEIRRGR